MFLGSFNYSIDAKNRISIPARFRKTLSPEARETFVMIRGLAQCIYLYPKDIWTKEIEPRLENLDDFDTDASNFLRLFVELCSEDNLDNQSRLTLPKALIEFAGIDRDVLILGTVKHIEIWNPEIFEASKKAVNMSYAEIAAKVMSRKRDE